MINKRYFVDFGPELLKLLGPNLYTNIYYVLGEIIANAYDADASNVYILYDTEENTIIIEDDGNGMSYEQLNSKYLPIGISSRYDKETTYTESGKRKRMGRKGIGKLAALSVAKQIKIMSKRNGEKSGCILSLDISQKNSEGKYEIPALDENEMIFNRVFASHGSAIIMEHSRYVINKAIDSAKRNISLIFPFASKEFIIHLENLNSGAKAVISDVVIETVKSADSLITFSDEDSAQNTYLSGLHCEFDEDRYYRILQKNLPSNKLPERKALHIKKPSIREKLKLSNIEGVDKQYDLIISGWICTYASTRDKKHSTDFPVNHISLVANGKLGQFDILSDISTDRMGESYVVGQFYVDLLEETDHPDIAASNRQGYKEDDLRYITTLDLIKKHALRPILDLKSEATAEKNYMKKLEQQNKLKESKEEFDRTMRTIIDDPSFNRVIHESAPVKAALEKGWDLKNTLSDSYKKIMISHNSEDKDLVDEIEKILHFCGFEKHEILYTSSDFYESGFEAYTDIYEYLKEFFVNTTRKPDLCIIYVLNENFTRKWNPVLEAGAGWVLNSTWYPMYTDRFESVKRPFPATEYTPYLSFNLSYKQAQLLASAIFKISHHSNKNYQTQQSILDFIKSSKLCG